MAELNREFPRTIRGGLKLARMVLAFIAAIAFGIGGIFEAYITLAIIELVISLLFFLLYLFNLQKTMKFLFWPLVDAFNSLVSALFLLIAGLCAVIKKIIIEHVVGGAFFLILCVLCIADAAFLLKNITFNRPVPARDSIHR